MADTYFPTIDKPEAKIRTVDVDLSPYLPPGEGFIAKLKRSSNFSDYLTAIDEKIDLIAKSLSKSYGCNISPRVIPIAGQIASCWAAPVMSNGNAPNRDDLIKFSVNYADAFGALVGALNDPLFSTASVADDAIENFTAAALLPQE